MRGTFRWTTESVFLVSGLLIILLGWVSDLLGALSADASASHGSGDIIDRIWFTFFGLLFVAGGVVYEQHWKFLNDAVFTERYLISYLFVADGAFHLYALTDHLGEDFAVAFFGVFAVLQIALGIMIPHIGPRWDPYLLAIPLVLIAAYVLTRMVSVWPINTIEEVEVFGIVSKLTEGLTALMLIVMMRESRRLRAVPAAPATSAAETR
ncbi:MAG TPA: hypothetical protein VI999_03195 [Thermoplasmata archaeon]|nr:hypothetical protein [Thermoplasmata archaeon]